MAGILTTINGREVTPEEEFAWREELKRLAAGKRDLTLAERRQRMEDERRARLQRFIGGQEE